MISVGTRRRSWSATSRTPGVSGAQGRARTRARARLQGQAAGQGDPLRRLRHRRKPGLVSVGRPRHRAVRGQLDPRWWQHLGRQRYPKANPGANFTADCGGSTATACAYGRSNCKARRRHWTGDRRLPIAAGTSKWNRIEHRLFSYITINWRGKPLHSLETDHRPDRLDHDQHPALRSTPASTTAATPTRSAYRRPDPCRQPPAHPSHPEWNYTSDGNVAIIDEPLRARVAKAAVHGWSRRVSEDERRAGVGQRATDDGRRVSI